MSLRDIVLCAPNHRNDRLTEFLARLADSISAESSKRMIRPVIDMPTKYSELVASINLPEDAVLMFVGHGDEDALLGPPKANSSEMSVFYNADFLPLGPLSIFAFCCSSAAGLGPAFAKLSRRTFFGFSREINFVIAKGQCTESWKRILHSLISEVIANGRVSLAIRKVAEQQYQNAYNYFTFGEGKDNEHAPLMAAFLIDQYRSLCILGE